MKGEHVMKKIICLMLAVIMAFSMSVSAFAAEIDANDEVSLIDNSITLVCFSHSRENFFVDNYPTYRNIFIHQYLSRTEI